MRAWECVNKGQDSQIHYDASHGVCVVVKSNNELDTLNTVVIFILWNVFRLLLSVWVHEQSLSINIAKLNPDQEDVDEDDC